MIFQATRISDVFVIDLEKRDDDRGFFARSWCDDEFASYGLPEVVRQCNVSFNKARGTLRGMHYQAEPHGEAKLVRCTSGAIYDVAVDLRRDSLTFKQWIGETLTDSNHRMLFVPRGLAHGFVTLEPASEVFYQMFDPYVEGAGCGVRWNDPAFAIRWPIEPVAISDRDRSYPDFK